MITQVLRINSQLSILNYLYLTSLFFLFLVFDFLSLSCLSLLLLGKVFGKIQTCHVEEVRHWGNRLQEAAQEIGG